MLCGIGARLIRVKSTVSPSVTRKTGPGIAPPNVHASYVAPSASVTVTCRISRRTAWTGRRDGGGAIGSTGGGVRGVPTGASPCETFAGGAVGAGCSAAAGGAGGWGEGRRGQGAAAGGANGGARG